MKNEIKIISGSPRYVWTSPSGEYVILTGDPRQQEPVRAAEAMAAFRATPKPKLSGAEAAEQRVLRAAYYE